MKYEFNLDVAKDVGVEEAIMFSNIQWRCKKNKANNKHFYEGRYRTYNSKKAFCELFPFWTERQIERIIKNLKDKNYVITGNFNKIGYDKTLWYAIPPNGGIDSTKRVNGNYQMVEPIPDSKPNNKTDKLVSKDTKKQSFGDPDINSLISLIKKEVEGLGLIYKAGHYERNRAKNILTAATFGEAAARFAQFRIEFAVNVVKASCMMDFRKGKVYNCETIYRHYAAIVNEMARLKTEKKKGGVSVLPSI